MVKGAARDRGIGDAAIGDIFHRSAAVVGLLHQVADLPVVQALELELAAHLERLDTGPEANPGVGHQVFAGHRAHGCVSSARQRLRRRHDAGMTLFRTLAPGRRKILKIYSIL